MRFFVPFVIVGMVALEGCGCETEFNSVTEDSKEWVPYAEGYYIPFEADSGKDTLDVISYEVSYSTYKRECAYREEQIDIALVSSDIFDDTIHFQLNDQVITLRKGAKGRVSIDLTFNEGNWTSGWSVRKGVGTRYTALDVDGKTFGDVINAKCNNCGPLSEVVVSRYLGIVAYKVNGVYWTMAYAP